MNAPIHESLQQRISDATLETRKETEWPSIAVAFETIINTYVEDNPKSPVFVAISFQTPANIFLRRNGAFVLGDEEAVTLLELEKINRTMILHFACSQKVQALTIYDTQNRRAPLEALEISFAKNSACPVCSYNSAIDMERCNLFLPPTQYSLILPNAVLHSVIIEDAINISEWIALDRQIVEVSGYRKAENPLFMEG